MVVNQCTHTVVTLGFRLDDADGLGHVGRQQQYVVACYQGCQFAIALAVGISDAFHVEAVGYDKAVETELLTQQIIDYYRAKRRRAQRIEDPHLQVRHHHSTHAGIDKPFEGIGIYRVNIFNRVIDDRQLKMTVLICVAMPGEVLGGG